MTKETHGLLVLVFMIGGICFLAALQAGPAAGNAFAGWFGAASAIATAIAAIAAWRSARASLDQADRLRDAADEAVNARRPLLELELERMPEDTIGYETLVGAAHIKIFNYGQSAATDVSIQVSAQAFTTSSTVPSYSAFKTLVKALPNGETTGWFVPPGVERIHDAILIMEPVGERKVGSKAWFSGHVVCKYSAPGAPKIWATGVMFLVSGTVVEKTFGKGYNIDSLQKMSVFQT